MRTPQASALAKTLEIGGLAEVAYERKLILSYNHEGDLQVKCGK